MARPFGLFIPSYFKPSITIISPQILALVNLYMFKKVNDVKQ